MFGKSITIGHVYQEIFLIEPTSGASIQKKQGQPSESNKKKGKDLPKKAEKQRQGARSDVQQKLGSGAPRRPGATSKGKANVPSLTEDARQAWAALQPKLDGSGELITLGDPISGSTHAEAQEKKGRHRASLRVSKEFTSTSKTSPVTSSGEFTPRLPTQSRPQGSLRVVPRGSQGKRKSLPITPLKSPKRMVGGLKEMHRQDMAIIAQQQKDLSAVEKISRQVASGDVGEAVDALKDARENYKEISKSIATREMEIARLKSQRLVVAASIASLDLLIAKNPQALFPDDADWGVLDESEGPGSPSRSTAEHRRVQTDRL